MCVYVCICIFIDGWKYLMVSDPRDLDQSKCRQVAGGIRAKAGEHSGHEWLQWSPGPVSWKTVGKSLFFYGDLNGFYGILPSGND